MGRRALVLLTLLLCSTASAESPTASLTGKVTLRTPGSDGKQVVKEDASDVVIYLTGFEEEAPSTTARLSQKDKRFIPPVLPIVAGQTVEFPNEDVRIHNVFSKSRARSFDLGKYRKGDAPKTVVFEKTGVVEVYCDIHEEMASTILVLPNRAFAVTDKEGRFSISGLPAGKYTAYAWHRRGEPGKQPVKLVAGSAATLNFTLEETRLDEKHLNKYGQPYKKRGEGY